MDHRRIRRPATTWVCLLLALGAAPGLASAHQLPSSKFDSPLPLSLLFIGGGTTVALTAGWLAVTERTPTKTTQRNRIFHLPSSISVPLRLAARLAFFAGFIVALVLGIVGRQVPVENFATIFTWPVWFRGMALISILIGTLWPILSPWHTLYHAFVWLEDEQLAILGSYPQQLASWPAVGGFILILGIFENLTYIPQSPLLTAVVLILYALFMIGGSVLYGTEWFRHADPLAVFYRLFGRVASITLTRTDTGGTAIAVRPPWEGSLTPVRSFSLVAFAITTVYTVSFDGFTNTQSYQTFYSTYGISSGQDRKRVFSCMWLDS